MALDFSSICMYGKLPSSANCNLYLSTLPIAKFVEIFRKVHSDAWTPFSLSSQKFLKEEWKNGADIYIVIHGFANTIKSPFITTTAAAIRNKMGDSVNIIGIDWGSSFNMRDSWGFAVDDYINAAFAISQVGAYAASLIAFLIENFKVNPSNITVIGHSLGGHVAHAISEHLQGVKIGRIFGLDLAGPLFSKGHQLQKQRLSKDDATMVAVLHTNGGPWYYGYLGLEEAVGHVDFYVSQLNELPLQHFLKLLIICIMFYLFFL